MTNKEKIFIDKVKLALEHRIRKEIVTLINFDSNKYILNAQTMREKKEATERAVLDLIRTRQYESI